jgi:hypothetical protein
VRLYRESDSKPVIRRLARQVDVHHEALRNRIRQDGPDAGERPTIGKRLISGNLAHSTKRVVALRCRP